MLYFLHFKHEYFHNNRKNDGVYPWNYYYIKYPVFRPGSFGKLSNTEADNAHLSRDDMGQCLIYANVYIVCENDSYEVYKNNDDSLVETITISQNDDGVDTEDGIVKLKNYIKNTLQ